MLCHGKGNLDSDGCCYVAGQPCPLRWKIVDGRIYEGPNLIDRGPVNTYIDSIIPNKPGRDKAKALVANTTYICLAAIEVVVADAKLQNNRPAFEAAWNAHPRYVAEVRPHWAQLEQDLGLPAGAYQCSSWKGTGMAECCFAEDPTTNAAKASTLTSTAVEIRQAGGT